jgi:hypothetical protein
VRKVELALGDVGGDDELGVDLEVDAEVGIGKSIKDDVDETVHEVSVEDEMIPEAPEPLLEDALERIMELNAYKTPPSRSPTPSLLDELDEEDDVDPPPAPPPPEPLDESVPFLKRGPGGQLELPEPDAGPFDCLRSGSWGCFRLTARPPGDKGGAFGAFHIKCLFHKKNAKSGCAKHITVEGASWADRYLAMRRALWWASVYNEHDTQEAHKDFHARPDIDGIIPSSAELQAKRVDARPDWVIFADAEIAELKAMGCDGAADGAGAGAAPRGAAPALAKGMAPWSARPFFRCAPIIVTLRTILGLIELRGPQRDI